MFPLHTKTVRTELLLVCKTLNNMCGLFYIVGLIATERAHLKDCTTYRLLGGGKMATIENNPLPAVNNRARLENLCMAQPSFPSIWNCQRYIRKLSLFWPIFGDRFCKKYHDLRFLLKFKFIGVMKISILEKVLPLFQNLACSSAEQVMSYTADEG